MNINHLPSQAKWTTDKPTALETLLTAPGEKPRRDFSNLISRATLEANNAKYIPVSAKSAYFDFYINKVSKRQSEVWKKRSATFAGYAALKESQRTTLDTTPDDIMDREPWIRKEIQEEIDAGDWFADYDIKVPEDAEEIPEDWALRVDPNFKQHNAEDKELAALTDKVDSLLKAVDEEATDSWRLRYTLTKPANYGIMKYFTH
jgi:hypothetical protein